MITGKCRGCPETNLRKRLLKPIKITFPIRKHSYLKCDKNKGLIDTKKRMEVPAELGIKIAVTRINHSQ